MIYLNNAATSFPKPSTVIQAVTKYLETVPASHGRAGFDVEPEDVVFECRKKLSALLNISEPERLIFTSGATESLNLAIQGLLFDGGHVVTTTTEHNSVIRPLMEMKRAGLITVSLIECDDQGNLDPEDFGTEIKQDTKLIIVNHCSNVTGIVSDIDSIVHIAHEKNVPVLVDASQSVGSIEIDVQKSGVDLLAFTGHKSLFGLPGTGGLYIGQPVTLRPLKFGGTGVKSEMLFQPETLPLLYEAGTANMPGIVSLKAGVEYIEAEGLENIYLKKKKLSEKLSAELWEIDNIEVYSGRMGRTNPLCCFNFTGTDPEEAGYIMESAYGILGRTGLHCAPLIHKSLGCYPKGSIRISPSCFNTEEDMNTVIEAVHRISGMKG